MEFFNNSTHVIIKYILIINHNQMPHGRDNGFVPSKQHLHDKHRHQTKLHGAIWHRQGTN